MANKEQFKQDGYFILKNAFSSVEIGKIRNDVYRQYEIDKAKGLDFKLPELKLQAKFAKGDLFSKELLYKVLLDDRVLKLAREVLGSEELVYFGDSSYEIGKGSNGFHRDSVDRTDLNGPDWKGKYTLVRLGLYLQDHKSFSGGLKVRKGSHKKENGKAIFIDSEIGDLLIWDLKTSHSGNAVRLKLFPNLSINIARIERNIPQFLKKEEQQERVSLFMTFALKSSHLDRYIKEYTLKRKDTIEHAKASIYCHEALETAAQKNVTILNPAA